MADPQTRSRLRGRFCKKNSASRSILMRNLNNSVKLKDNYVVADHEYTCTFGQKERDPVPEPEIHENDIDVADHVTIGADDSCNANSPSWKDGRRVVELGMLAQQMYCDKCRSYLHLSDIIGEKRYGLGSLLEVKYRYCSWISLVSTGKRNDKGAFDINSKVALAMVHSGMGASHVVNFLSTCNIPPPDPSTLRKKEKDLSASVVKEATYSCDKASVEEKEASKDKVECSFDGGWQKRGSGWQYNSNSGHASLIGSVTGKITEFDTRTRCCSFCQYYKDRGLTISKHDCNSNWTGTSKGIEHDMAISMIKKMKQKGCEVQVIHSDNDSTTAARLRSNFNNIVKKDDRNHVKKNLSKQLYGFAKKFKELKPPGVIPYIKRCFMYAIQSHQLSNERDLKTRLESIVPHLYGDHSLCSADWCTYWKNPTKYRYNHLPNGKPLSNDDLREQLKDMTNKRSNISSQLINLGSTNANENCNHMVASKAPKNRSYGRTQSLKTRVSAAVLHKNEGYTWVNKVNKRAKLSPGFVLLKIGKTLDRRRQWLKSKASEMSYKRKRIVVKKISANHENVEGVKEGSTYEARIAEDNSPDIETIPSPMDIKDKSLCVVFDLEATGLARSSDITQLSAFDGTNSFNMYVRPRQHISKEASAITGITFSFESNQMFLNGNPVECHEQHGAFISFLEYLQKKDRPILVGHNISAYDVPVLTSAFREHGLLSTLLASVYGCIDTLHVAKRCISKSCVSHFKQETLVKTFLGRDYQYEAHNSMEDVKSLPTFFNLKLKNECCSTDIFPFNISVLNASYNAMVQRKLISNPINR